MIFMIFVRFSFDLDFFCDFFKISLLLSYPVPDPDQIGDQSERSINKEKL